MPRAAREAFEEAAGVVGKVRKRSIGSFPYVKVLPRGATASRRVQVFPLRVTRQYKKWPEKARTQDYVVCAGRGYEVGGRPSITLDNKEIC
jgi:hypothetical protein